ncbi:MAG TPA: glycoside hydrolase family 36 protein [Rariglobus sp.]|nr:glycoside hydrolase family 36 protein [Rariglobus sp.]
MSLSVLSEWTVADTTVRYLNDPATGAVTLQLVPTSRLADLVERRATLAGEFYIDSGPEPVPPPASVPDPLVHVKRIGDSYPGAFAQGHTLRSAPANAAFRIERQEHDTSRNRHVVLTRLLDRATGHRIDHRLSWHEGDAALTIESSFINGGTAPVTLELLTSFSLGGLTPFARADAPDRMRIHRFRSAWSAEGRLETRTLEELHLERSWSGAGLFSERFGQIGTMPVRRWFPFVALEDTGAGVTWAAQLGWGGSWQMEIARQNDDACLSGGLADREFGHWTKTVAPGERLDAPPAYLACVSGDLDAACDRLTALQHRAADTHPVREHTLPIIFNEWCTTWGDPSHAKVTALADRLKGSSVSTLVIDAGWYKTADTDWGSGHGDWVPSPKLFANGIEATAAAIRERGLIPGLWFEMETVGDQSTAFSLADHFIQRDGLPVTVRHRRFWNLSDPRAFSYLEKKVIDRLEAGGFGYLKIDYNETLGLGGDHPDGLGEGLRQQILATYRFLDRIRERLPELVIENCSSGGHRLEPSLLARTAMASFSDAHELVEIPIIAANLHRLMLPRQSQIWAVLKPTDTERRLIYSLAATFLGRMCLSGDVAALSSAQWQTSLAAQSLYTRVAPVIKHGVSRLHRDLGESWRHPRGWQAMVRVSTDGHTALVVAHAFAQAPSAPDVTLPPGNWRITDAFAESGVTATVAGRTLTLPFPGDFSAFVILLKN